MLLYGSGLQLHHLSSQVTVPVAYQTNLLRVAIFCPSHLSKVKVFVRATDVCLKAGLSPMNRE